MITAYCFSCRRRRPDQIRSAALGQPDQQRFRAHVSGFLPGSPSEEGEFVMSVRRYGDRPGWWISPDQVRQ